MQGAECTLHVAPCTLELMSIHVALNHITHYRYDRPVTLSPQLVRLRPAPHCRTPILSYSQRITPAGHFLNWQQDPQSNYLARLTFPEQVREFSVEVDLVAEMAVYNPFDFFLEPTAEIVSVRLRGLAARRSCSRSCSAAPLTPRFAEYLAVDRPQAAPHDRLAGRSEPAAAARHPLRHPAGSRRADGEETLDTRTGSCRDTAWLLVQLLRHLGLAARFVSGYLIQLTADVKAARRPAGPEQRLHRSARVVRGLSAGRRLDRPRSDVGPARRRRAYSAGVHARAGERRAGHGRGRANARSSFDHAMAVRAHLRVAARHQAVYRRAVGRDRSRSAARSTRDLARRRRAADDGRRADVRVGRRSRRRRVEHRGARPDQAARWPPICCCRLKTRFAHGRLRALRPGQVVSRRAAAALGARLLLARRRRAGLARSGAVRRRAAA